VKKAQGVRIGRPRAIPAHVVRRIRREHADGRSMSAIAEALNNEAVPTATGAGKWYQSTVSAVLNQHA
jgi:hypothetical protein